MRPKLVGNSRITIKYYIVVSDGVKVRVKCTLVQALRLCTCCTAHRESRGVALLFLDRGSRRGEG